MNFVPEKKKSNHSVVLDLDDTLIQTLYCEEKIEKVSKDYEKYGILENPSYLDIRMRTHRLIMDDPCSKRGTGEQMYCWTVERPGLEKFLTFCFNYFRTVNVWTAGVRSYGEVITESIFKKVHEANHIFTREECKKTKKGCVKQLEKMIERYNDIGPIENLFLVDDNPVSFAENKSNAIMIPPYSPKSNPVSLREDDHNLDKLVAWFSLDDVRCSNDITKLKKDDIFDYSVQDYKDGKYTVKYN